MADDKRTDAIKKYIKAEAKAHGLNYTFLDEYIKATSNYDPRHVMQSGGKTYLGLGGIPKKPGMTEAALFDIRLNIRATARFLNDTLNTYGFDEHQKKDFLIASPDQRGAVAVTLEGIPWLKGRGEEFVRNVTATSQMDHEYFGKHPPQPRMVQMPKDSVKAELYLRQMSRGYVMVDPKGIVLDPNMRFANFNFLRGDEVNSIPPTQSDRRSLYGRPVDFSKDPILKSSVTKNELPKDLEIFDQQFRSMVANISYPGAYDPTKPAEVPFFAKGGRGKPYDQLNLFFQSNKFTDLEAANLLKEYWSDVKGAIDTADLDYIGKVSDGRYLQELIDKGNTDPHLRTKLNFIHYINEELSIDSNGTALPGGVTRARYLGEIIANQSDADAVRNFYMTGTNLKPAQFVDFQKSRASHFSWLQDIVAMKREKAAFTHIESEEAKLKPLIDSIREANRNDEPLAATKFVNKLRFQMEQGNKDTDGNTLPDRPGQPVADSLQRLIEYGSDATLKDLAAVAIKYQSEKAYLIVSNYKNSDSDNNMSEAEAIELAKWHPTEAALFALVNKGNVEGQRVSGALMALGHDDLLSQDAVQRNALEEMLLPQFDPSAAGLLESHRQYFNPPVKPDGMTPEERKAYSEASTRQRESLHGVTIGNRILMKGTKREDLASDYPLPKLTKLDVVRGRVTSPQVYGGFTEAVYKSYLDKERVNKTAESEWKIMQVAGLEPKEQATRLAQIEENKANGIKPWVNDIGEENTFSMLRRNLLGLSPQHYTNASNQIGSLAYQTGLIDYRAYRQIQAASAESHLDNTVAQGAVSLATIIGNSVMVYGSADNLQRQRQSLAQKQLALDQVRMDRYGSVEEYTKAKDEAEQGVSAQKKNTYWAASAAFTREGLSYAEGVQREKGDTKAALALSTSGGAVEGASMGAQYGNWKGAVIGAIVGAGIGYMMGRRKGKGQDVNYWQEQANRAQISYYNFMEERSNQQDAIRGAVANASALAKIGDSYYTSSPKATAQKLLQFTRRPQFASDLGLTRDVEGRANLKFRPKW